MNLLGFIEQHRPIFEVKELQRRKNYPDGHWMLRDREPVTLQRIQTDHRRIAEFKPLASFKLRRDKYHAHFDKEYFFDRAKLQQDAPLTWGDLQQVVQLGKEILNSYSADYDGSLHSVEPINAGDVDYLLDQLHQLHHRNT